MAYYATKGFEADVNLFIQFLQHFGILITQIKYEEDH